MPSYPLSSFIPKMINNIPVSKTIRVIPPLTRTHAAFPHEAKGIPGSINTNGTITNINPKNISNHLFIVSL